MFIWFSGGRDDSGNGRGNLLHECTTTTNSSEMQDGAINNMIFILQSSTPIWGAEVGLVLCKNPFFMGMGIITSVDLDITFKITVYLVCSNYYSV